MSVAHAGIAKFSCIVSPRDQVVTWFSGVEENRVHIEASEKYLIEEDYKTKTRTLTIKDCQVEDRYCTNIFLNIYFTSVPYYFLFPVPFYTNVALKVKQNFEIFSEMSSLALWVMQAHQRSCGSMILLHITYLL